MLWRVCIALGGLVVFLLGSYRKGKLSSLVVRGGYDIPLRVSFVLLFGCVPEGLCLSPYLPSGGCRSGHSRDAGNKEKYSCYLAIRRGKRDWQVCHFRPLTRDNKVFNLNYSIVFIAHSAG